MATQYRRDINYPFNRKIDRRGGQHSLGDFEIRPSTHLLCLDIITAVFCLHKYLQGTVDKILSFFHWNPAAFQEDLQVTSVTAGSAELRGWAKFRTEQLDSFQFMSGNLNWIVHITKEAEGNLNLIVHITKEAEGNLNWNSRKREFTELEFNSRNILKYE